NSSGSPRWPLIRIQLARAPSKNKQRRSNPASSSSPPPPRYLFPSSTPHPSSLACSNSSSPPYNNHLNGVLPHLRLELQRMVHLPHMGK
uniref:Uncharacterized protein n=1 Tax=Aegilops tauschii subsp. strangulata TaxID=200361 RepID=A0A453KH65_AEGTS